MAIDGIMGCSEVLDAAVTQKGKKLSLVLVVAYGTPEAAARELGDNFARMVKAFGPGPKPEKKIGEGIFDYLVGVFYPDDTRIALGAKVSSADHITW